MLLSCVARKRESPDISLPQASHLHLNLWLSIKYEVEEISFTVCLIFRACIELFQSNEKKY